jgi:hypothetical protein
MARLLRISALVGAAAWTAAALGAVPLSWMETLFLLGPLVAAPLGLALAGAGREAALQPLGAAAAAASFAFPAGGTAAGIAALGWTAACLPVAARAVARILRGPLRPMHELAVDAALASLAPGAGALAAARFGLTPLGFGYALMLLMAIHFHFAGFGAALLSGLAARALPGRRVLAAATGGVAAGPPIVAIGFACSPALEFGGAALLAASLCAVGVYTAALVRPRPAGALLLISSLSAAAGMVFAALYAWGEFAGTAILDIPTMAQWHGTILAFGFVVSGLVGRTLLDQPRIDVRLAAIDSYFRASRS